MAEDAVSHEPVSTPNSLLTGKLTGIFANSGTPKRLSLQISKLLQLLAVKFPERRNREFYSRNREFFEDNREILLAEMPRRAFEISA